MIIFLVLLLHIFKEVWCGARHTVWGGQHVSLLGQKKLIIFVLASFQLGSLVIVKSHNHQQWLLLITDICLGLH